MSGLRVLLAIITVIVFGVNPSTAAAAVPDQAVLTAVARESLLSDYSLVMGRNASTLIPNVDEFGIVRNEEARRAQAVHQRDFNLQYGLEYTSVEVELIPASVKIVGARIELRAVEHTTMHYVNHTHDYVASRDLTRLRLGHNFEFEAGSGAWTLVRDIADHPDIPIGVVGSQSEHGTQIRGTPSSGHGRGLTAPLAAPLAAGYYDWQAAARYADQWAESRNPSYRDFAPEDCTNFVSQALYAGGWQYRQDGYYDWFYYTTGQSLSWINAYSMKQFLNFAGRATFLSYFEDLLIGDVLTADWYSDGSVNHQIIVDDRLGGYLSGIYLDYHNTDRYHYPLSTLLGAWPTSWNTYWAWRITGTY